MTLMLNPEGNTLKNLFKFRTLLNYLILFNQISIQMETFYWELSQLRCTELQLKMRLAGLHLKLKRVDQKDCNGNRRSQNLRNLGAKLE